MPKPTTTAAEAAMATPSPVAADGVIGVSGSSSITPKIASPVFKEPIRASLTPAENLAVGALGGALETFLQMPVLTYKFCLQEGRPLPQTPAAWYRGVGVQAGTVAPITALQFMVNGMLQGQVLKRKKAGSSLTDAEIMASAAGAGAVSSLVYSPVDLITIQQQKKSLGVTATIQSVIASHGLSGLYRGLASCAGREAIYTAGYLGLAPVISSKLSHHDLFRDKPLVTSIVGACIAGTTAALLTHPLDTLKTCVQSDLSGKVYPSATQAIPMLWKNGGIASLYRGVMPRTVRLCGAFFVCLIVRDAAIDLKTIYTQESE